MNSRLALPLKFNNLDYFSILLKLFNKLKHLLFRKQKICFLENIFNTGHQLNGLIVYITSPFFGHKTTLHQNVLQTQIIAAVLKNKGYNVDIVDFGTKVAFSKKYHLIIDIHPGLTDYQNAIANSTICIALLTGCEPDSLMVAEKNRILSLQQRRNSLLRLRRTVPSMNAELLEKCQIVLFMGNKFNFDTYNKYKLQKSFFIPNTAPKFEWASEKIPGDSHSFLFFTSTGQVLRGLDLLLEVFAEKKDYDLFVCSSFVNEPDFCNLYHHELYHCSNIHPVGFIDISSQKFQKISKKCAYLILPSASEGMSGSVLVAMAAGIIPIATKNCGFDEDTIHIINQANKHEIANCLEIFGAKSRDWVISESRRAIHNANTRYDISEYSKVLNMALDYHSLSRSANSAF